MGGAERVALVEEVIRLNWYTYREEGGERKEGGMGQRGVRREKRLDEGVRRRGHWVHEEKRGKR